MAINNIFEIGRSGLNAMRQAIQTTSHNIANVNTPGYTRQRPVLQSREQSLLDGAMSGGGVDVNKVIRVHDQFIDKQIQEEAKVLGGARMRSDTLKNLEGLLHSDGFELAERANKFFNDFRDLSLNPESGSQRNQVMESTNSLVRGFREVTDRLEDMKAQIDQRIEYTLHEVNGMAHELAGLNEKIANSEMAGRSCNELLDRRESILRSLAEKIGFNSVTDERNQVVIGVNGLGILVNGTQANSFVAMRTAAREDKASGSVDVFLKDGFGLHQITDSFKEGELGGLLHVRDQSIRSTFERLDEVAYGLTEQVNLIHEKGTGIDGSSGNGLFGALGAVEGSSRNIRLNADLKGKVDSLAAGMEKGAVGDNRIALEIANLQEKPLFGFSPGLSDGVAAVRTIGQSLNAIVGRVATETGFENEMLRHQELIVNQLENYRQSVAGVSLEEEAMNLIQFQAIFNASAKTMKMGDELLQTILSLKT